MILCSSPLKVKEDDEVDDLDIKLDAKRKTKRVYQSPNTEVNLKISRSLKVSIHFSVTWFSCFDVSISPLLSGQCSEPFIWMIFGSSGEMLNFLTDFPFLEYNLFCLVG